ncbi:hypothetical protein VNO77_01374 [Canavalia gladiata]|uniref:Uncharacterized protein n=1 Tax=Canavalia gladiata TaxID=3824 RepID=A0AAN9MRA2_CANGL
MFEKVYVEYATTIITTIIPAPCFYHALKANHRVQIRVAMVAKEGSDEREEGLEKVKNSDGQRMVTTIHLIRVIDLLSSLCQQH